MGAPLIMVKLSLFGEMAEWSIAAVLKTVISLKRYRGFESPSLLHFYFRVIYKMSNFKDCFELSNLISEVEKLKNSEKANHLYRFFKTNKGEYGEGDKFLGLSAPKMREIAFKYRALRIVDIDRLVKSDIHEKRAVALIIMTLRYPKEKDKIYDLYLKNIKYVNSWDLVDISCYKIIGDYLFDKSKDILYEFSKSKNLWERRISIISTFSFIKNCDFLDSLNISEILISDSHDLIHKAVGWMLREISKKDKKVAENFLNKFYYKMSRTTLRYAIEKFPENERKEYLRRRSNNLIKINLIK
jgi:3-methyladenine DNA glycosylase AlkD